MRSYHFLMQALNLKVRSHIVLPKFGDYVQFTFRTFKTNLQGHGSHSIHHHVSGGGRHLRHLSNNKQLDKACVSPKGRTGCHLRISFTQASTNGSC